MGELYVYDVSTHLTTVADGSIELSESAESGQVAEGHVDIEDSAGTLALTGHKAFRVEQSDCSTITTFRGYVGPRDIQRDPERGNLTTTARTQRVALVDLNARLGFHRIFGTSWIRPAETISARLTALLASSFLSSLVADNGFVDYPTTALDKTDCRGMTPGDVLADMAVRVGYNHFVYWDEAAGEAALWFKDSNTSTDFSSTLRISNVASEVDSTTTFAPSMDTVLHRDPSLVVSKVGVPFKNGYVIRSRAATETTYQARDGIAPSANIRKWAKARDLGDQYLYVHRNEEDRITTRLLDVPSSKVNLIRAGMRIEAKFTEFTTEGYGSAFTWFRVLKRTVVPLTADGLLYEIRLDLSPQEEAQGEVALVQYTDNVDEVNIDATFPSNVTIGNVIVALLLSPQGTQTTPNMQGSGWTQLDTFRIAYEGATPFIYAAAWAKVADSISPTYSRETTGPTKILFGAWELSGTSIAALTTIAAERQPNSPMTIGTLTGPGIAMMSCGVTRGNDQTTWSCSFTPGTGWTERKDHEMDGNSQAFFGNATVTAAGIEATGTINILGGVGQSVGEWAGFAVLAQVP